MVMPAAEMAVQTRLTQAFIDTDPEIIVMHRSQQVRDLGTGELKWEEGVPQPPITVRIQEYQTNATPLREVATPGGEAAMPELYLLAMPDTDVQEKDWFEWRGLKWQVDTLHPKPDYEIRGDVVRYVSEV